ncbi:cupin domain-containing protein [Pseudonocardia benzenivorans]|jgi:mannose-6-phosphate isomerase-like protein (cupin superfamily)|uniref:Cupin 2 conserved barrel domain protein n=2 Tax=Pseudonocardia TaxID=1847 RepID=F4D1X1_PSEUX|nr:cupin domain-containing protein [Pseudonocardia dioxanivorans]AEA28031.1 Cupin 2 conserved barrel domain protein [Pseudonocardia dioxanivorans CB1190]
MAERSTPFILEPDGTRREGAFLPFKVCAPDTGGLLSVCEFTLDAWDSGPVLHRHTDVDEAFYVVSGALEMQLDDERLVAPTGGFAWVPRGTAHTFANGGTDPVHVIALAVPGGIEDMFAEQAAHIVASGGAPDESVLDEIGRRHGATTLGPPIRALNAPAFESP